jgi:hypothetical protein
MPVRSSDLNSYNFFHAFRIHIGVAAPSLEEEKELNKAMGWERKILQRLNASSSEMPWDSFADAFFLLQVSPSVVGREQ